MSNDESWYYFFNSWPYTSFNSGHPPSETKSKGVTMFQFHLLVNKPVIGPSTKSVEHGWGLQAFFARTYYTHASRNAIEDYAVCIILPAAVTTMRKREENRMT